MSSARSRREGRVSSARRRAETHSSGFSTTVLNLPAGVHFFEPKEGVFALDFLPFKAKRGNPFAEEGDEHYERTFWVYRKVGPDEKSYVCSSKTFGKPDFIQEYRQKKSRDPAADADLLKSLEPKERQIFLVFDQKNPDKGIQLYESSYHTFGKLLDERIKKSPESRGWDFFFYPDEEGFTLELTFSNASGGDFSYLEVSAIDFVPRKKPLPEELANHGYCLDDFLVETPYEELKKIFLGIANNDDDGGGDGEDKQDDEPKSRSRDTESSRSAPKDEPKKEEKKEEPKLPTATDLGFKKGSEVSFEGKKHTVLKIAEDGLSVTLSDEDDELKTKIPVQKLATWKEKEKAKEEKKSDPPKYTKNEAEAPWDEEWPA